MDKHVLKQRTKAFVLEVIRFINELNKDRSLEVISKQLLRSATGIGANYRSACKAQSYAHFISKIGIVEEETDETLYWLELLEESGLVKNKQNIKKLLKEAGELSAIFTATSLTARKNKYK